MDFLTNFKLHVILLSFPILLWQGYVKAQGDEGIKSNCVIPQSYIGDTVSITCHFSVDLLKESKTFRMYLYDLTTSGRKNEKIVLECYFRQVGVHDCGSAAPGYEFNGTFNNQVTVTIPKATLAFQGSYECRAEPSYPQYIDHCVLLFTDKATTSIAVVGSSSGQKHDTENTDGTSPTAGISAGVLILVLVGVGVALFLLWKRKRIGFPCIKATPPHEHRNDEENTDEVTMSLLNPEQSTEVTTVRERPEVRRSVTLHEETISSVQGTFAVLEDRQNNQTRHDSTHQETDCIKEEINETRSVREGTERDEHAATNADTTPDSVDLCDRQSSTLDRTEARKVNLQESAEAVLKGPGGKETGHVSEVLSSTVDETTENKQELERLAATPELCGKEDPAATAGIDHRAAETSHHSPDRDAALSDPQGATAASHDKPELSKRQNDKTTGAQREAPETEHMDDSVQHPRQPSSDTAQVHQKKNLLFYQNLTPCRPDGLYLADIHSQWRKDMDFLDKKERSVQWLFPTHQEPKRNPDAQQLHSFEAEAIKADKQAYGNFLKSYELLLNTFGLQLVSESTGEVKSAANCTERFDYLQKHSRNHMRLTRVLYCLGELGLEHYKVPLLERILEEISQGKLRGTLEPCRKHWIPTVSDSAEKERLIELHQNVLKSVETCSVQ